MRSNNIAASPEEPQDGAAESRRAPISHRMRLVRAIAVMLAPTALWYAGLYWAFGRWGFVVAGAPFSLVYAGFAFGLCFYVRGEERWEFKLVNAERVVLCLMAALVGMAPGANVIVPLMLRFRRD